MKVEIEPQFAKNLLAYLAEKPIKEAMGAYSALTAAMQEYEYRLTGLKEKAEEKVDEAERDAA